MCGYVDQSLVRQGMEGNPPRGRVGPTEPAVAALSAAAAVGGLVMAVVGYLALLLTPVSPHLHPCATYSSQPITCSSLSASEPYKRNAKIGANQYWL